jgi:uncharacterized protein involved in exopolysaccharide biosynthesis
MIVHLSPRYVAYTLFKRWQVFALFFMACMLLAGLYVALVPWRYESDAQIVFKIGEQDIAEANPTLPPGQMRQQASGDIMRRIVNTQLDILQSTDVTRATLEKVGVAKVYPEIAKSPPSFFGTPISPIDAANNRLVNKDLTVTVAPNSNTLEVSLLNTNPLVAQQTLRTLIAVFMAKDSEVMRNPRANFLEEQVAAARAKVNAAQNALLEYKRENGITSLDHERLLLLNQRDLLEQDLSAENTTSLQQSVTSAHNLLAGAEQRYLQAEQTYTPDNPLLQDARRALVLARRQYDTLMQSLANNPGSRPQPLGRPRSASKAAANNALTNLWVNQLKSVNDRLDHLNQAEGGLLNLQRQLAVASQDYTTFMQRTADARVTEALNQQGTPSIAVSQEPTLPFKPAKPRILLVLALGVVLGLFGGFGLCFFLEATSETIGLPEQVEPLLGLPVVATLNRDRAIQKLAHGHGRSPS